MKRVLIVILAVFVLLFAAGAIWWHEMNVVPNVSPPKPPPMPSPNAYDYFVSAYSFDRDDMKLFYISEARPVGFKDPDDSDDRYYSHSEQEALLKENLRVIAKVREGLAYGYYPVGENPPDFYDRNLAHFREEARLLGLASVVHTEEGNWKEALQDELDCITLGEKIEHGGAVVDRLVGIACQAIGRKHAWDAIDHLAGEDARKGAFRLESIVASQPPLADAILADKWRTEYDLVRRFRERGRAGTVLGVYEKSYFFNPRISKGEELNLLLTSKQSVIDRYGSYVDAYANRSNLSYGSAAKPPPLALPSDPLSKLLVSYTDYFSFRNADNDAANDLLIASLALRAYKADHGEYPASLSQLVPRYLHAMPADPFAATGPMHYRKTAKKYVLYSVGPDGVDDGGKPIVYPLLSGQQRTMVQQDSKGDMVAGFNVN